MSDLFLAVVGAPDMCMYHDGSSCIHTHTHPGFPYKHLCGGRDGRNRQISSIPRYLCTHKNTKPHFPPSSSVTHVQVRDDSQAGCQAGDLGKLIKGHDDPASSPAGLRSDFHTNVAFLVSISFSVARSLGVALRTSGVKKPSWGQRRSIRKCSSTRGLKYSTQGHNQILAGLDKTKYRREKENV